MSRSVAEYFDRVSTSERFQLRETRSRTCSPWRGQSLEIAENLVAVAAAISTPDCQVDVCADETDRTIARGDMHAAGVIAGGRGIDMAGGIHARPAVRRRHMVIERGRVVGLHPGSADVRVALERKVGRIDGIALVHRVVGI